MDQELQLPLSIELLAPQNGGTNATEFSSDIVTDDSDVPVTDDFDVVVIRG